MGQYYYIVNVDKEEYIHPHSFLDGLKLMEFASSGMGAMLGLAVLLADGNNRGGGDLRSDNPIVGSWAGDRIVVAGDYADGGNHLSENQIRRYAEFYQIEHGVDLDNPPNVQEVAGAIFKDISEKVLEAACDDSCVRERYISRYAAYDWETPPEFLRKDVEEGRARNN